MNKERMTTEEFKAKITKQFKDPGSILSSLLCSKDSLGTYSTSRRNIESLNHAFWAKDYGFTLQLRWDATAKPHDDNVQFCRDDGAHNLRFASMNSPLYVDITDNSVLKGLVFYEESVKPSDSIPNGISFGLRSFRIRHQDYEYIPTMVGEVQGTIVYDLVNKKFIRPSAPSIEEVNLSEWISEWHRLLSQLDEDTTFIFYIHDDAKHLAMQKHLQLCDIDDEYRRNVLDCFSDFHQRGECLGLFGFLQFFDKRMKALQSLDEYLNEHDWQ